jgi:hypothetical protein
VQSSQPLNAEHVARRQRSAHPIQYSACSEVAIDLPTAPANPIFASSPTIGRPRCENPMGYPDHQKTKPNLNNCEANRFHEVNLLQKNQKDRHCQERH